MGMDHSKLLYILDDVEFRTFQVLMLANVVLSLTSFVIMLILLMCPQKIMPSMLASTLDAADAKVGATV